LVASPLAQLSIPRRDPTAQDVQIEITHCGVCHSDLHVVRDEWSKFRAIYPVVPGHEAVGRVTKVGSGVTRHSVGDLVAVGVFVDSCRSCALCRSHQEHLCATHVLTYNTPDPPRHRARDLRPPPRSTPGRATSSLTACRESMMLAGISRCWPPTRT